VTPSRSYSDSGVVLRGLSSKMGFPVTVLGVFYGKHNSDTFQTRKIDFTIKCFHADYTLRNLTQFQVVHDSVLLFAQHNFTATFQLRLKDYYDMWPLPDYMYCSVYGKANDTASGWIKELSMYLQPPKLEIILASYNLSHTSLPIRITGFLSNPLPVTMTNITLLIVGYNLGLDEVLSLGTLEPQDSLSITRYIRGDGGFLGMQSIVATIICDQFTTEAFADILVT